jgi:hypothetical protein
MSTPTKSNRPDTVKQLRHDLGSVLGNLRAFEYLYFAQPDSGRSTENQEIFADLMTRLDAIVARMERLESEPKALALSGGAEAAR